MSTIGLLETLVEKNTILNGYDAKNNRIIPPDHSPYFYSPGCFVLLTAFAKHKQIPEGKIYFSTEQHSKYAEAIGLPNAVWGIDTYKLTRKNQGKNYSPLVHLDNEMANDEWAQSLPEDVIGNPLRGIESTKKPDNNHHMGLGLFKLTQLIKKFSGELKIASGDKIFLLASNGKATYKECINKWQGVAISCKFGTRYIEGGTMPAANTGVQEVFDLLKRS